LRVPPVTQAQHQIMSEHVRSKKERKKTGEKKGWKKKVQVDASGN
jgi:hypothetical protein